MKKNSWNILNEKNVKITKQKYAFKGYGSFYNFEILNSFNHGRLLKDTEFAIRNRLIDWLAQLKGFQFVIALVLVLIKIESDNETKYYTFYSHSKLTTMANENDINDVFEPIYTTVTPNIKTFFGKSSGWSIASVIEHNVNISKYNPLAGSSYIRLSKELDHPRKGMINI